MQHPEEFLLMEPRLEEVPIPDEAYDSVYLEMVELWPARVYQKFQYWPRKDPRGQVKRRGYQGHLPPHSETDRNPNPPVQPPPAVSVIINPAPPPLPPKPKRGLAIPASQPDLFGQAIQAVITVPGPSQRLSTDRHTHANSPSVVAPPKRTAHTPKGPVKSKVTVVATPGTPGHPGKTTVTVGGAGGSAGSEGGARARGSSHDSPPPPSRSDSTCSSVIPREGYYQFDANPKMKAEEMVRELHAAFSKLFANTFIGEGAGPDYIISYLQAGTSRNWCRTTMPPSTRPRR